ncbi:phage/plasmid-associated DNA primase [Rhodoblastus acidophilus]|uniref:DUF5906 domain-containing protein n=1 Tax=Rhodoblastus acidophilus TaxID=1074 RepID=UPI00222493D3|nr:DUF5906 domain-containing protein [Rhodoblastus acidophilus]MCW2315703.1 phage/plasmid-associated DNA primase [Rhodoblastus acidophilus]
MTSSSSGPEKPAPTSQDALNAAFLHELFQFAEMQVFLTALPNQRGDQNARQHERTFPATEGEITNAVTRVIGKYDRDGQAIYFCASTLDPDRIEARRHMHRADTGKDPYSARSKETIGELVALWVDIDLKNVKLGPLEIKTRLGKLRLRPTVIIDSGNGLHVWYFLTEALPATPENIAELEALLGLMCFSLGGDKSCCEVARLMRLPGSHNTKRGEFKPVNVLAEHSDFSRRYDFAELQEFWHDEPRVLTDDEIIIVVDARTGRARRQADGDEPENPYVAFVRSEQEAGHLHLPPLDYEKLIGSMVHGSGEHGVHNTMVRVTASLVHRGFMPDEIVSIVLDHIGRWVAEHGLPQDWQANWAPRIEERARVQIAGAVRKAEKSDPEKLAKVREKHAASKKPQLALVSGDGVVRSAPVVGQAEAVAEVGQAVGAGSVVPFKVERRGPGRPPKERPRGRPAFVRVAHAVLDDIRRSGRDICFVHGDLWTCEEGIWKPYEGKSQIAWLDTATHATVQKLNEAAAIVGAEQGREEDDAYDEDARFRAEVRQYIATMPELWFSGEWDTHGLTPLANGLFDPATRTLTPYEPKHRATYRMAAHFDPDAKFVHGLQMIRDMFEPYGADADGYVRLFKQFLYVAIFKAKQKMGRKLRRCLYLQGDSNSGKSELVNLVRLTIGVNLCSSTTLAQLSSPSEGRFALQPLMCSVAWVADEVVEEHTKVDASRIKALLAEDRIQADRKGAKQIEARYLGSAIFSANHAPRTTDTGDGFAERFMFVHCPVAFDRENPAGVALLANQHGYEAPSTFVAAAEMAGILNWALEERDFIERERRFEQPADVIAARETLRDDNAPLRKFIKECLVLSDRKTATKKGDLYAAYQAWHQEDNGNMTYCRSPERLMTAINTFFHRDKCGSVPRSVARHHGGGLVVGVKLNEEGLSFWRSISERKKAGDKNISSLVSDYEYQISVVLEDAQIERVDKHFKISVQNKNKGNEPCF